MKFLQASKILNDYQPTCRRELLLASSCQTENLEIYIQAEFALQGVECYLQHTSFNTLQQHLMGSKVNLENELVLVFPWDFLASLDWRTGIAAIEPEFRKSIETIREFATLLKLRETNVIYIDVSVPPVFSHSLTRDKIRSAILSEAYALGALVVNDFEFSLSSYLEYGTPFSGKFCSPIARKSVEFLSEAGPRGDYKVLVTDLDNVMWAGVIGEDGIDNIRFSPQSGGYMHYIYQTYLKKLERSGTLIAVVSKNDADLAIKPFKELDMPLKSDDLVTLQASYHSKSGQIQSISNSLNLPTGSFVFVDDNRLEIEEVSSAIADIKTLLFPQKVDDFNPFMQNLARLFNRLQVTEEDRTRTQLYRTRTRGMTGSKNYGSNLDNFLRELEMGITVNNRSLTNNDRALQLINKTNQFNLNGRRVSRQDLDNMLGRGYQLFSASLSDRHGDHGEILACLIDEQQMVQSLVMSCRVLERQVELFFVNWLCERQLKLINKQLFLSYAATRRNEPFRLFLEKNHVAVDGTCTAIDTQEFLDNNKNVNSIFKQIVFDIQ